MKKKMLITGASGFLGSRITQYYRDKYEVLAPSHSEMDIADACSVKRYFDEHRPDIVIHCAAISDVGRCEREPELSWQMNVIGTENIVKAAKELSAKCICCSSDQVYCGSTEDRPNREEDVLCVTNVYGKGKAYAEKSCLAIYEKSVHLRLSWMYDAKDEKRMDFIKQLRACLFEEKEVVFSVKDKRGITDVWEVVRNIEAALELPGGIYNFGAPNDKSTYEMVMHICQSMGYDTSFVSEMENAKFRNLTMAQEKINRFEISFSMTEDGVLHCLKEQI